MAKRKNPHPVALGRRGGLAAAGTAQKARWANTTPEERSAWAKKAAAAQWSKKRTKTRDSAASWRRRRTT